MIRRIGKFLDKRNVFFPGLLFSPYYDRIDKKPSLLVPLADFLLSRLLRSSRPNNTEWRYRWNATRRPAINSASERIVDAPEIELLIVAAEKDFSLLSESSRRAIQSSLNPITTLTLVVPASATDKLPDLSTLPVGVKVVEEESLIDASLLQRLKCTFKERSGWLLQQYLTIRFVEENQARGVLTLDADTLLIEPQLWLDTDNRQILHVSSEYVPAYYEFLASIDISEAVPITTHVTHHMLMQPWLLRSIFEKYNTNSHRVLEQALDFHLKTGQMQFCLEFELYGQAARRFFQDKLSLGKFCNRTVQLEFQNDSAEIIEDAVRLARGKYHSISAHSYSQDKAKN
jgi:hypothetical protein